jgi:peptide/histidine transporter 3/4
MQGMILLTLSVSLPSLKPPECPTHTDCKNVSKWQVGVFYFALYVVAVGVAGVKPCFSSLGADQFDEEDETERPMKRSFFNYWWVAVTGGSLLAVTVLVYIEDRVGFGWGYGIPTVGLAIATAVLLLGTRTYRFKRPMGSPLTQIACVLTAAFHKYKVHVPEDPNQLHEVVTLEKRTLLHTDHLRYDATANSPAKKLELSFNSISHWSFCIQNQ